MTRTAVLVGLPLSMTFVPGLQKAIAFLRGILMYDSKNNDVFWA